MVEAANIKHPIVNLDEFERRLRGPDPASRGKDDPLAELARLVSANPDANGAGAPDALTSMFARASQRTGETGGSVVKMPRASWDRVEPGFAQRPAPGAQPLNGAAQLQESLRGSLHTEDAQAIFEREMSEMHARYDAPQADGRALEAPHPETAYPQHEPAAQALDGGGQAMAPVAEPEAQAAAHLSFQSALSAGEAVHEAMPAEVAAPAAARPRPPRRPVYIMSAIFMLGATALAGTFVWRASGPSAAKNIAVIKAQDGPVKVATSAADGLVVPNQDATVLDKGKGGTLKGDVQSTNRVVARDEQPIDLNFAPKAPAPAAATPKALLPPTPPAVAADAPPPASDAPLAAPKKVKTVSVRPDGSLVVASAAPPPVAAAPLAVAPSVPAPAPRPAAAALAAVPAPAAAPVAAPPKPKATVRVAAPKADVKSSAPAIAPPDDPNAPLQLRSAGGKSAPRIRVADATATATTPAAATATPARDASAGGGFAVQLASPGSEKEAQDTSAKLRRQFAGELGGRATAIRPAEIGGQTRYRIRVPNLSRDEATALCSKLKEAGGACFVAGN